MACLKKRGKTYYLRYYAGTAQREKSLGTASLQIAKEKLRQFESSQANGTQNPLPGRTPLAEVLQAYCQHIRATKTAKSAQNDIYYLRDVFGPVCEGLTITSRRITPQAKKRPRRASGDRRRKTPIVQARYIEAVTTPQIAQFIDHRVTEHGIAPKTANHYRSILRRFFNWASQQHGVRLPGDVNPAAKVRSYREQASAIRYLTLDQIDAQLEALAPDVKLQTMVAVLIYAGLRREELLWLTLSDVDTSPRACGGGHGLIRVQAKTKDGRYWQPKTGINRVVPVSRALREHLETYRPQPTREEWFFSSPQGTLWDPDNFSQRHLAKVNRSAGLPWTCLDFRHTFGSQLAQNGVSLYKIATLMGNSPEICRRHYASLVPEAMAAEVEFR